MLILVAFRVGEVLLWLALWLMAVGGRKDIIIDGGGGLPDEHGHIHFADGEGNPGLPLRTDASGRLIVREAIVRSDTGQLSFESAGGSEGARVEAASSSLRFYTSGSERVRIASDGKVGIGTSSPGSTLEITLGGSSLGFVNAGTAGATEAGWVEVKIGGSTMYLRAFASI